MNVYQEILDAAPNGTHVSAGDLHEEIWFELLKLEDPTFHNVRLARGDGGIDGITFIDPTTGEAHIVQAKFFADLTDPARRSAVVSAFLTAHRLAFACSTWELLLPRQVSHHELQWLMVSMKMDALAMLDAEHTAELAKLADKKGGTSKKQSAQAQVFADERNKVEPRIRLCSVKYRDGDDLERLMARQVSVAAAFLPSSKLTLEHDLARERKARVDDQRGYGEVLEVLRQDAIRQRQLDSRTALAALKMLNQGWTNHLGSAQRLIAMKSPPEQVELQAADTEEFTERKAQQAFEAEALVPGVSDLVHRAHYEARLLRQVAVVAGVGMAQDDACREHLGRLIDAIGGVQRAVGDALHRQFS